MIYTIVRKDKNDKIDAIISFDSVASMDESWSATVTSQTVENGFNITDNINIESPTYNINATLSSYSLFAKNREIVWDGNTFKTEGNANLNYHIEVREQIKKVFSERRVVTLVESSVNSSDTDDTTKVNELKSGYFKEIDNCIITSLNFSHPDSGTGAITVSMTLQKITVAKVAISELMEGEKRALIKPLAVNFEPFNGAKKATETGEIDPTTGLPSETAAAPQKGNWDEQNEIRRGNLNMPRKEKQIEANAIATQHQYDTGKATTIVQTGAGWSVIEGTDKSALMRPDGGLVDVVK